MGDDLKWIIGISVSMIVSFIIALVAAFRSLSEKISDGDNTLHERINRTRDEYVKRVDHDAQLNQYRETIKEMRDELREGNRETNKRLDQVLAVLAQDKK